MYLLKEDKNSFGCHKRQQIVRLFWTSSVGCQKPLVPKLTVFVCQKFHQLHTTEKI